MKIHQKTRPKVLCADSAGDDLIDQVRALYGGKWEILTAKNGDQALQILEAYGEQMRFAILSSFLPLTRGVNLCSKLRLAERWKEMPILLVGETGKDCPNDLESGKLEFITRSNLGTQLAACVDRCLASYPERWLRYRPDRSTALIVDDTKPVRDVLKRYLSQMNVDVMEADSGCAMEAILEQSEPDFILMDVMMPTDDGLQLLKRLRRDPRRKHLPVIMVSGLDETDVIAEALELGAVDYISKPICLRRLRARVQSCLDSLKLSRLEKRRREELMETNCTLQGKVDRYYRGLQDSHRGMIFALSKLAESRDPETGEHLERLQEYCRVLCEALRSDARHTETLTQEFVDNLVAASPLHDIGKVGIPDAVLLKPGRLTAEEFDVMKTHAQLGADTLAASAEHYGNNALLEMGIELTQFHHEKWDGSGYPSGLSGESIPLSARILALGDVYDALTSKRVYKDAFSHDVSRSIILEGRGSHFDPTVVDAFLRVEERFKEIRLTYRDSAPKELVTA